MVAPAALIAAGWNIEELRDPAVTVGTVGGHVGRLSARRTRGGPRWGLGRVHYPKELGPDLFIGPGRQQKGPLIRFVAEGCTWNHQSVVAFDGVFSDCSAPLLAYADGDHPRVPGNRFVDLSLIARGDDLDAGLLTCVLTVSEHVGGTADQPCLVIRAAGHFGAGGGRLAEYRFVTTLSTHGTVHLRDVEAHADDVVVSEVNNQIVLRRVI